MQNVILGLIDKNSKTIIADLSKVQLITSYDIGMLIYTYTICKNIDIKFFLVGIN